MLRPRILFYAVNGLGLGHVTRLLAIARKIREQAPDAEIVFFTSSEAEDVVFREGFSAFKVPSRTLRLSSGLSPGTYSRMLQTITLNLIAAFRPNLMVVDTFPAGAIQELLPVLRWGSRNIFVFRAQRPDAANSLLMQNSLRLYHLVVVPHSSGEEVVPLPEGVDNIWTGPILVRDRTEAICRKEARRLLGLPMDRPTLYITFGGGGDVDMENSMQLAIQCLAGKETPLGKLHLAVARPPLYRGSVVPGPNVSPLEYYPMAELYSAFDCAISAAGYNSSMELLHHGVPTAFLPSPRQVDDQEARANRIAKAEAGLCLLERTRETLQSTVDRLLDPSVAVKLSSNARAMVPDSGAERAAAAILGLLPYEGV